MALFEPQRFTVTEEHVKLLRNASVSWEGCEFGAPSIDCKRPYGNGNVYEDIGEIIGLVPEGDDEEFTDGQLDRMNKLHKETETALQIFLATGRMEPGFYEADEYDINWRRI